MDGTGSPTPRKDRSARTTPIDEMGPMPIQDRHHGLYTMRSTSPVLDNTFSLMTSKSASFKPQAMSQHGTTKTVSANSTDHHANETSPVDMLLARLSESSALLAQQKLALSSPEIDGGVLHQKEGNISNGGSASATQADAPAQVPDKLTGHCDASEIRRLKQQLEVANSKISKMDEELSQNRITKHTLDQAMGSASEYDFPSPHDEEEMRPTPLTDTFLPTLRSTSVTNEGWNAHEDSHSDHSDLYSTAQVATRGGQNTWMGAPSSGANYNQSATLPGLNSEVSVPTANGSWNVARPYMTAGHGSVSNPPGLAAYQAGVRGGPPAIPAPLRLDGSRANGTYYNDHLQFSADRRVIQPPSRPPSSMGPRFPSAGYGPGYTSIVAPDGHGLTPPLTPLTPLVGSMSFPSANMYNTAAMFQSAIGGPGSRLSPTAAEFNLRGGHDRNGPWNHQISVEGGPTYISPTEPINYRRLLDRNMSCNWSYIVDKIVRNNDQQASIFLQQKLKACTADQKYEIIDAIIAQAYPLMINRFGNFLIQRCFEHGAREQVIAIANAIRGNTLTLSMDPFGCHVVQKAFDSVPEEYKAIMVHELLRRIPETVVHRYACHVWQKLFELRWSESPPQIMKYVNEALRGMWHEVALGETGSLVVQNIFENCLEEDKRPCINEVLASIDVVAHGQFGNWCIQHICEHGDPADRSRAIDHILRFSTEYSMDQYASKVIEKCLKIGGTEFLDRYLERLCEVRPDRPRIPLIDIAGDQFGNYLMQWVLQNTPPQHREIVASHVRKHMVSLRGSKYGSRVAMLCTQPQFATRPGVPSGMQLNRFNSNTSSGRGTSFGTYR